MNYGKNHEKYREYKALKNFFVGSNDFIDLFLSNESFKKEFDLIESMLIDSSFFDKNFRDVLEINFGRNYFEFTYFIGENHFGDYGAYEKLEKKTCYVSLKNKAIIIDTEHYYMSEYDYITLEYLDDFLVDSSTDEYVYQDGAVVKTSLPDMSGFEKIKSLTAKKHLK